MVNYFNDVYSRHDRWNRCSSLFFCQEPWSLAINRWILTTIGQHTVVGLAIYLVLISLLIGGAVILSPNTNNGSFVNRHLAVGKDENYED